MLNKNSIDSLHNKMLMESSKEYLKWFKSIGVNYKELELLKNGKDVFLDTKRLNEILNYKDEDFDDIPWDE